MREELKHRAEELPDAPGVYVFRDAAGATLYVGKAKSLRDRVSQYFSPSYGAGDPRLAALKERIHGLEFFPAESEVEAIMLEARLIKDLGPRYNVKERDDKSFGLLVVTSFDDYAKVWFRRETDPLEGEAFGPFPHAGDLRRAIRTLQKIFRFATCNITMKEADPKRRHARPCLLYSIHRCTAPCAAKISRAEYAEDIGSLKRFLRGERADLERRLERRMRASARELEFEKAAELRDQIAALRSLQNRFALEPEEDDFGIGPIDPAEALADLRRHLGLAAPPRTIEACDIATIQGDSSVGSVVAFEGGVPNKAAYRRYRIKGVRGIDDFGMIREVVRRRFARLAAQGGPFPDIFLVDGGLGQLSAAAEAIESTKFETGAPPGQVSPTTRAPWTVLLALAKEEETLFRRGTAGPVPMPKDSLGLRLLMHARDEAHRFAQRYHHLLRRKRVLGQE